MAYRLAVEGIHKYFGEFQALKNISFDIEPGKFVTLLGPSGCGKTTLLRVIAGFLEPDGGRVIFGGRVMNEVPPNKRNTAMCFQSYALFPHKTVFENICFGLRMRKIPAAKLTSMAEEAMNMVDLNGLGDRKPYELSGGQQQRVALARAVVVRPDILLFDEPLSNLDAKLREKVRVDIRNLQRSLGITTVYVTHDQAEALAISDVIIAMNKGEIVQISDPRSIYDAPKTKFVASFIGTANIVKSRCTFAGPGYARVECPYGEFTIPVTGISAGSEQYICIRPEDMQLITTDEGQNQSANVLSGRIVHAVYMGNTVDLFVEVNDQIVRASVAKDYHIKEGAWVSFAVAGEEIRIVED